jgi:hypothetical protein
MMSMYGDHSGMLMGDYLNPGMLMGAGHEDEELSEEELKFGRWLRKAAGKAAKSAGKYALKKGR